MLRAYRFDSRLFSQFEADCDRHLRNPRAVLEALIFHWLKADARRRDEIASKYQENRHPATKPSK
jgi:hypothetical protein